MKAFISYSHEDEVHLARLHTHLAVLKREGRIDAFFDRDILAGRELHRDIAEQLESCRLFLLLVSPDFLASDYCIEREMVRALERHGAHEAIVIPIIIEPCDWASTPLRHLRALQCRARRRSGGTLWSRFPALCTKSEHAVRDGLSVSSTRITNLGREQLVGG